MKPRFCDIRDRLHFVETSRSDYDLSTFPDFFVAGPQRTGTTWLYQNLAEHPEVFIPEQKEIYYFNTLEFPDSHADDLPPVQRELGWYLDLFEPPEDFVATREAECQKLFGRGFQAKARGDATATYAAGIGPKMIAEIFLLNPNLKVITMVRDPIDRAWSQAKLGLCRRRGRQVEEVPEAEWLTFFRSWYQVRCGKYSESYERWASVAPPENLFVGRFRDIIERPTDLLLRVYDFLGIDRDERYIGTAATRRINATKEAAIPPKLRAVLEDLFADEVEHLKQRELI